MHATKKKHAKMTISWVDLHDCVVDADKVGDKVEVSGDEHHQEENLGFPRDPRAAPRFPYLSRLSVNLTNTELKPLWS